MSENKSIGRPVYCRRCSKIRGVLIEAKQLGQLSDAPNRPERIRCSRCGAESKVTVVSHGIKDKEICEVTWDYKKFSDVAWVALGNDRIEPVFLS